MTWRRQTRAEARAEALAEYRDQVRTSIEHGLLLQALLEEEDKRRAAALDATGPILAGMSSAEILDVLHAVFGDGANPLPCDDQDVLSAVLLELERRRNATAHEKIRLRALDRNS
ncbi:MAG TPA: hypothetical protein PKA33_16015 [Amaricoccus sp.]|uniref:hypothetical protein n=1 Tax=Amaricoccus sp. TaxID=1872485 RepID=UPI002BA9FE9D|nr:hypothetical protein [Amaricoccus sp.]HMQ92492.1 hypothetical protein [Amaricoccus sp.]HMR53859.1 hypothetical protein [Amaricoccus sp.]HMR58976.1 hypothetical protein [Amaricoccus sp.]HMU00854.1 hypothetical protein [Amaricoccus sp.]